MSQIQDWNDQSIQDDKNKYVIGDVLCLPSGVSFASPGGA